MPNVGPSSLSQDGKNRLQMPALQLLILILISRSRRHDHSFPEGIISGRREKSERGLFYDFKILLTVVILAQAFHIQNGPIFF